MNYWKTCVAFGVAFLAAVAQGRPPEAPQTAHVSLASRSIQIGEATGESAYSVLFGTPGARGRSAGNGEFRPSTARPGFYESAYVVIDHTGDAIRRLESGTVFVAMPTVDSDSDTIPDSADVDAEVTLNLAGEAVPNAASLAGRVTQPTFLLRLQRASGTNAGEFMTDLLPGVELGGDYHVVHYAGTVDYSRTDTMAMLDYSISGAVTNAFGAARVVDTNTLRTTPFRLRTMTWPLRIGPAVLARTGNVYRGELSLLGRGDFRPWVMQITDANDQDANGVPDLSDILLPYIAVQPKRQIAGPGETVTLSVVVTGTGPFTFAWEQNGHGLSNVSADPNSRVLVLPNLTADDKGSYRVRVSNAAGSVVSDSTSLSFR